MNVKHKDLFLAAAKHFYKAYKKKGGTQQRLADRLGVTQSYLSSILNGARTASFELQVQIANRLYGPYDKFLAAGRNILKGGDPEKPEAENDVENLLTRLSYHIVQKKIIEEQLQTNEQRFADIVLASGDLIFELDRDLTFTYLSGDAEKILGSPEKEVLGKSIYDFMDASEVERIKTCVEGSIAGRRLCDQVITFHRDGKAYYRHIIATPVFSEDNGQLLCVRGKYKDITRSRMQEKEIDKQKWLLQPVIDALDNTGILILDERNNVLRWNTLFEKHTGIPQEILETRNLRLYLQSIENKLADAKNYFENMRKALESRKHRIDYFKLKNGMTIKREMKPLMKDGGFGGYIILQQTLEMKGSFELGKGSSLLLDSLKEKLILDHSYLQLPQVKIPILNPHLATYAVCYLF